MTIRLSIISLAGMARTLVAVGTSSDADMFFTTAAAAPRSTCTCSPSAGGGAAGAFGLAGAGAGSGSGFGLAATPLAAPAFGSGAGRGSGGAAGGRRLPVTRRGGCVGGWFRGVVDQEFMPTGVYRGGILAELAVHLLDQPLVLSEW